MSVATVRVAVVVALSVGGFAAGCAHALEMKAKCASGLALNATVDSTAKPMPRDARSPSRLDGSLKVINPTAVPVAYSNRSAILSGARAYVDSVASHAVDSGSIKIQPGEQIELRVYWPSQIKPGTTATNLTFKCKLASE